MINAIEFWFYNFLTKDIFFMTCFSPLQVNEIFRSKISINSDLTNFSQEEKQLIAANFDFMRYISDKYGRGGFLDSQPLKKKKNQKQ